MLLVCSYDLGSTRRMSVHERQTVSRRGARSSATVWVLAFGSFAVGTGLFALGGVLPQMARSLGTSVGAAGQAVTVFALTYAIAAPLLATAAGRWPARRVLLIALVVFSIGNAATAAAPTLTALLASRVVAALGAAAFTPVALGAAVAVVSPERRGRALATVMSGLNGSLAVGVPLGIVLSRFSTWRSAVVLVAALGIVAVLVLAAAIRTLPLVPRTSLKASARLLRMPRIVVVLAVTVLSVAAGISAYTYIADILGDTVHATGWTFLVLLVLYGVGAFLGSLTAGRLTDTFGANRTVTAAIVLLLLVLALVPFMRVLAIVAVLVTVWGAAFVASTSPQQHTLVTAAPDNATVAVSLNSSGIYLGQALGAAIAGLALQAGLEGRQLPFLAAALAVAALVVHVIVTRMRG